VILANQRYVAVGHILEFKESLTLLLVGSLFILLASRLHADQILQMGWRTGVFVVVLLLVARPAAVWVSTVGSNLDYKARLFMAWMAPRGIVAAAVSSVFAARLELLRIGGQGALVPNTFAVIIATVSVYGLTTSWLGRRLGISKPGSGGFLIAGSNPVARQIAAALKNAGQEVLLVDTSRQNINAAKMEGLNTFQGNIFSDHLLRRMDGTSIARLLALTSSLDVNSLAAVHFSRHFGRSQVYQLALNTGNDEINRRVKGDVTLELRGRLLFDRELTFQQFHERLVAGHSLRKTLITREYEFRELEARADGKTIPLFVIEPDGEVNVSTADDPLIPKPGQSVIVLARDAASQHPPREAGAPDNASA
jgi:hypothetical protein